MSKDMGIEYKCPFQDQGLLFGEWSEGCEVACVLSRRCKLVTIETISDDEDNEGLKYCPFSLEEQCEECENICDKYDNCPYKEEDELEEKELEPIEITISFRDKIKNTMNKFSFKTNVDMDKHGEKMKKFFKDLIFPYDNDFSLFYTVLNNETKEEELPKATIVENN